MKKIILKKSEIAQLSECTALIDAARIMMREGALLKNEAEETMWKKIKEICPDVIRFVHPRGDKWYFECKEKHELSSSKK